MRHSKIGMSLSALGQSRPIDGGSVSALPPFATKSVRLLNAASGQKRHFALR